jgi:predicted nucleic acid-binding protein
LDKAGLLAKINAGVITIYQGRKWLDIEGLEGEGRISYKNGLALGIEAFQEAQTHSADDLQTLFVAEYMFLVQELELCASGDTKAIASLTKAIQEFDEAFLALEVLQNAEIYQSVEKTYSHRTEFRHKGMPKDAFHVACAGHKARLDNILRSPGINITEKQLLKQRYSNMATAQSEYLERQKRILPKVGNQEKSWDGKRSKMLKPL